MFQLIKQKTLLTKNTNKLLTCFVNYHIATKVSYENSQILNKFLPSRIGLLGYGAIGTCFADILLEQFPVLDLVVCDALPPPKKNRRFDFVQMNVTKQNVSQVIDNLKLKEDDFLVDLSCDIFCKDIWLQCQQRGIRYLNTASETWPDDNPDFPFPYNKTQQYSTSLGQIRKQIISNSQWKQEKNLPTTIFEMGCNPGLISHFVKKGLMDCASYYLVNDCVPKDVNKQMLHIALLSKNYSKIAQALDLKTIHCSETDTQYISNRPADLNQILYNTWSGRAFLTEAMIPAQIARGSHEDLEIEDFNLHYNNNILISKDASYKYLAKSWLPNENIVGTLIPHGECYSISDYLRDPDTGYSPSQYFVYDYCNYAREFMLNLRADASLASTDPDTVLLSPEHDLKGYDKIGAMLIMGNNRGWWTGSVMDDIDASQLLNFKHGPTAIQVAAGAYAGFLYGCKYPRVGCHYPETLPSQFILEQAEPYIGRLVSKGVDLKKTCIGDCYKFQDFLIKSQSEMDYIRNEEEILL